jgi:hypothetical protein
MNHFPLYLLNIGFIEGFSVIMIVILTNLEIQPLDGL